MSELFILLLQLTNSALQISQLSFDFPAMELITGEPLKVTHHVREASEPCNNLTRLSALVNESSLDPLHIFFSDLSSLQKELA